MPRPGILTGAVILALGMATAFGTVQTEITYPGQISEVIEQIAAPEPSSIRSESDVHVRELRIRPGATVNGLLTEAGISDDEATSFLRSNEKAALMFRQLAPGKTITAQISATGALQSLIFPLNSGKDSALVLNRSDDKGLSADIKTLELETKVSRQNATIEHSLFAAADDAGIPESVASQLADIFGGDIDFHRDLRKGDRFSVIYETTTHMGKLIRTQRILAAEFINDGKTYRAYWYPNSEGNGGYYTEAGHSIRKSFLRSPLEFSRVTSGFSNARFHPVLHETRAHHGIDYGAPTGTRVKATGDGIVEFSGIQGGYGKLITIRHSGNRVTAYGHLSGFAPGIKNGARVSQGDVIGYVGATGLATGPHLHYEFRVAGVHRNPLTVALPDAAPLAQSQFADFRSHIKDVSSQLAAISDMRLVMLD